LPTLTYTMKRGAVVGTGKPFRRANCFEALRMTR
jgi:hypothetical protein